MTAWLAAAAAVTTTGRDGWLGWVRLLLLQVLHPAKARHMETRRSLVPSETFLVCNTVGGVSSASLGMPSPQTSRLQGDFGDSQAPITQSTRRDQDWGRQSGSQDVKLNPEIHPRVFNGRPRPGRVVDVSRIHREVFIKDLEGHGLRHNWFLGVSVWEKAQLRQS